MCHAGVLTAARAIVKLLCIAAFLWYTFVLLLLGVANYA